MKGSVILNLADLHFLPQRTQRHRGKKIVQLLRASVFSVVRSLELIAYDLLACRFMAWELRINRDRMCARIYPIKAWILERDIDEKKWIYIG